MSGTQTDSFCVLRQSLCGFFLLPADSGNPRNPAFRMYDARFGFGIIVNDICSTLTQSKHSKYKIQCCSPLSKIQNKVFTSSLKYKLHCCSPPLQKTESKNIIHLPSRAQVLCSFCFSGGLQSRLCYICTGTVIFMYLNIVFSYFVTSEYFNVFVVKTPG